MKAEITYPKFKRASNAPKILRTVFTWLFLAAGIACTVTNLAIGGKKWFLVVDWSLISIWSTVIASSKFEVNKISQTVKVLFYVVILLVTIDYFLAPGWAEFVVPLVCFGTLILLCIFFVMDIRGSMQNTMPIMWVVIISLLSTVVYIYARKTIKWPLIVLASVCGGVSLLGIIFFGKELLIELKKRFHTD